MRTLAAALCLVIVVATLTAGDAPTWVRVQEQGQASLWVMRHGDGPLEVKLSATLTVAMRVEGEDPLGVEFSEKDRRIEGWHLEKIGKPTRKPVAGTKREMWEQIFKATPQQKGRADLPFPAVQITNKDGTTRDVHWTPLAITVTTRVTKEDAGEARDLAPIEEVPPPPAGSSLWWLWSLAGLPVVALAAWFLLRRKRRPEPEKSPADIAVGQLAELTKWPTVSPTEVERLHTRLSEVLRRYLEKQYDLPAMRRTTPEFFAALSSTSPLANGHQAALSNILERCDLAKFAGVTPAGDDCRQLVGLAIDFVTDTGAAAAKSAAGPGHNSEA
jgi:hypothetical protein